MKTKARHSVKRGANAVQRAWLNRVAACVALAFAAAASAQTTVRTLGGGPKSFPLATNNASGSADGNTFKLAQFNVPYGVALDNAGNLYMADFGNKAVRKVSNVGLTNSFTSTIVTGLSGPIAVAVDAANNLYVLTQGDGTLRKYDSAGSILLTNTTALTMPTALALDANTNLIVTELGGTLKRVTNASMGGVAVLATNLVSPLGVAVLATNSIAIVSGNAIVNLNPVANTTNLIAGSAAAGYKDGLAADALFNTPHQMVRAPDGSLIVCDRLNHRVRVVSPQGTVSTLYGVGTNQWVDAPNANPALLAGWVDGAAPAAAREPLGVTINSGGTNIFVTEAAWHLLRTVTGSSFVPQAPSGSGNGGGTVNMNSNLTANLITFGFESGEGSTDFIGAPGQTFFAPVTLTLIPGQKMYSLGFSMAATNDTGSPPITSSGGTPPLTYSSMLQRPIPSNPTFFEKIPPSFAFSFVTNYFTNTTDFSVRTNIVPTFTNAVFLDTNVNVLSVAWLETVGRTNLYNTLAQDLIKFSQAHINQFLEDGGSVIAGGFGFQIPATASTGMTYRIQVFNATAQTNLSGGVNIAAPTNGSLTTGPINSVKKVTVNIKPYLVGDVSNFRWFNAGDFGDGTLTIDDASQTFNAAVYQVNIPPVGSDFFDAMDSSNGTTNNMLNASSGNIDNVTMGDGEINVDDVFVTLRRSLNPYSTWYVRYWTNGFRTNAVTTNNLPKPTFGMQLPAIEQVRPLTTSANTDPPLMIFSAGDAVRTGPIVTVPVNVQLFGPYPLRVLMLRLRVQPLDGSPVITQPVQFNLLQSGAIGNPFQSGNPTPDAWFGVWLNDTAPGIPAGNTLFGNLLITLPANAPADASYLVRFDHVSGSPNGLGLLPRRMQPGLVTITDRSTSSFGDGLPDQWRLRWFGSLFDSRALPMSDPVGDGMPNWVKLRAGINPLDPSQSLRLAPQLLTDIGGRPTGVTLRWPTVANKRYVLEGSSSLGNWSPLSTNITGSGADAQLTNSASGLQFYRLRLVEP